MVSNGIVDVVFNGGIGRCVVFDGVVGVMFDRAISVMFDGAIGVMFDGVASVLFNGVMGVYIHLGVHDFFVGVASRSPSFEIFIKVFFLALSFYGFWRSKEDGQSSFWCWC